MKILITGASGFIGSFIVEEALKQGMETWAAVRRSSSRQYLQDGRIHFIELDLSSPADLERPSVLAKLSQFKEMVKNAVVDRTKRKELER